MSHNWCVFCGDKISVDRLACDQCRPLVKELDRKRRRTFEREEKRLQDLANLWAAIQPLKREGNRLMERAVKLLREYLKEKEEQEKETEQ